MSQGDLQVAGVGVQPPIQCEGFLCSVVFLTPRKGVGSLGETKAATEASPDPIPVYAVAPVRQLEHWGRGLVPSRPCLWRPWGLGTHVFGLRPTVLGASPEGVGRWGVPEGI